jgi:hypothetical protein
MAMKLATCAVLLGVGLVVLAIVQQLSHLLGPTPDVTVLLAVLGVFVLAAGLYMSGWRHRSASDHR